MRPGFFFGIFTVIQNAFANTSSSITSAKVQGNIVDTLMPPLSAGEMLAGYLAGSVVRAGLVALVMVTAVAFAPVLAMDFVWDDEILVLGNSLTHSWGTAMEFFRIGLWESTPIAEEVSAPYYRPLMGLSLTLDRTLWGFSAAGQNNFLPLFPDVFRRFPDAVISTSFYFYFLFYFIFIFFRTSSVLRNMVS